MMAVALYMVFFYVPPEKTRGVVQRIFYFHVSSAWITVLAFFLVMVASIGYLISGKKRWDTLAHASAEIGTLFCTLVLITGILWAKPVWNTWWTWDTRLTTILLLWLIYLGYLIVRTYTEGERSAKYMAVFGIIAFIDVPVVVYLSFRWWQIRHSTPIISVIVGFGVAPEMWLPPFVCLVTFGGLFVYLLQHRIALETMKVDLEKIRQTLTDQYAQQGVFVENHDFIIEEYNFQEYKNHE